MGTQRMAGVRCITWKSTQEQTQPLKKQLNAAVARLAALLPAGAANAATLLGRTPFEEKK